MARPISIKVKTVETSTANHNGKPPPGDKSLGIEPFIRFYDIEGSDKTEEGEEAETLIIQN